MPQAVRFDRYGGIDVLYIGEVDRPVPGDGQVLVRVKAAGINPGEAAIREGAFDSVLPATFPSGQGSDLAGVVEEIGDGAEGVAVGDEVIGFVNTKSSQAELVVEANDLTPRPADVPWVVGTRFPATLTVCSATSTSPRTRCTPPSRRLQERHIWIARTNRKRTSWNR
jgi:NADPH:quinone reductase-like Zn-dependent oxidoreductase